MPEIVRVTDPNYVTDKAVHFYTPRYYAFDSFSAFAVELWDKVFPTAEHAYQWKKFDFSKSPTSELILSARSARDTKIIGEEHVNEVSTEWNVTKLSFMEVILRAKLTQHDKVRSLLLETVGKDIIENSPTDSFWGIGEDGKGENHLGKLWMKLRSELE